MKERAIEFAEWILKNRYRPLEVVWVGEDGVKYSSDLYLLFEKENTITINTKESVYGC